MIINTFTPPYWNLLKKLRIRFLIFFFLLIYSTQLHSINVVFRYDDPTLQTDSITQEMLVIFKEKNVPLTIALIPCDANEEYITPTDSNWLNLLQGDNVEIALHGLTHQNINNAGEFGDLTYEENYRRISKGKHYVEQYFKPVITFIPPFNAYNCNTLLALDSLGFKIISSDLFNTHSVCSKNINYFPETLGLLMNRMGMFESAKHAISNNEHNNSTCVVMFHHYNINTTEKFNKLKDVVEYCISNPNVKLYTFRDLTNINEKSSASRYLINCQHHLLYKQLKLNGSLHKTWFLYLLKFLNILLHIIISIIPLFFIKNKFKWYILLFETILIGTIIYLQILSPMKGLLLCCCIGVGNIILWYSTRLKQNN